MGYENDVFVNYPKFREYAARVGSLKKSLELEVGRMEDGLKNLAATCEGPAFTAMRDMVLKETQAVRARLDELSRHVQRKLAEEEAFIRRLEGRP